MPSVLKVTVEEVILSRFSVVCQCGLVIPGFDAATSQELSFVTAVIRSKLMPSV